MHHCREVFSYYIFKLKKSGGRVKYSNIVIPKISVHRGFDVDRALINRHCYRPFVLPGRRNENGYCAWPLFGLETIQKDDYHISVIIVSGEEEEEEEEL